MAKFQETVCSCDRCKSMCLNTPCSGTPDEIEKLIEAGYEKKLDMGFYNGIDFVRPKGASGVFGGRCAFLTDKFLCSLHKLGLKPLEGRIAIHGATNGRTKKVFIVNKWNTKKGRRIVELFKQKLQGK